MNKASRSRLLIFPVATTSSRRGERRSRWLSRKSLSFVTTTRSSASAAAASDVCRSSDSRREAQRYGRRRDRPRSRARPAWPVAGHRPETSRCAERHAALSGHRRTELKRGQKIVAFEVGVILDDLFDRHSRRQQLQQGLDWVPQPAHRRLPMTDRRIDRDPLQPRHVDEATAARSRRSPDRASPCPLVPARTR